MKKYLWCEDSGSGFQFWCAMCNALYPEITVETKYSNTGLRKAAGKINPDDNIYFILIDTAVDNPDVLRESKKLNQEINGKSNVHLIKVHSFEFALLSFDFLEEWVFAEEDDLKDKRENFLKARKLLIKLISNGGEASDLSELRELIDYPDKKNTEQIAAKVLFEITRNTGFETNKGKLGQCFVNNCCDFHERQANDICGLDDERLSSEAKAELLLNRSVLKESFERVGLYK